MFAVEFVWKNPALPTPIWWLTIATAITVAVAVVWNWRAWRIGLEELGPTHLATFFLACLMVVAYTVLLITDVNPGDWSAWLRPVALTAFAIVWTGPAIVSVRLARRLHRRVIEIEQRIGNQ